MDLSGELRSVNNAESTCVCSSSPYLLSDFVEEARYISSQHSSCNIWRERMPEGSFILCAQQGGAAPQLGNASVGCAAT